MYIETIIKTTVNVDPEKNGSLEITGNISKVMEESIHIAHTQAKLLLNKLDPDNKILEKGELHLHIPEV